MTAEADEPLSLVGVGTEEAKAYVEGTLLIGEQVLPNIRLWVAPINLTKVLLGNDVLAQVARIELEYGNLRRFQVASVKEAELEAQPDLVKRAVEHLKKLRTIDFGDTVLNAETQERIRELTVKWARIFSRDEKGIGYNDSMPMHIDTGDAKPVAQAVRRVPYALREPLEKKLQTCIDMAYWYTTIQVSGLHWCSLYRKRNRVKRTWSATTGSSTQRRSWVLKLSLICKKCWTPPLRGSISSHWI